MKYILENPYDVEKLQEAVRKAIEGKKNVEFKTIMPPRSLKQNAFLHAIIGGYACNFGYTIHDVKVKLIKMHLCKDIFMRGTRKDIFGEEVVVYRSTTTLDVEEFTQVIERFRNYAAMQGFYIPDPESYKEAEAFRVFCEKQIDQNQEYLYLE